LRNKIEGLEQVIKENSNYFLIKIDKNGNRVLTRASVLIDEAFETVGYYKSIPEVRIKEKIIKSKISKNLAYEMLTWGNFNEVGLCPNEIERQIELWEEKGFIETEYKHELEIESINIENIKENVF